MLKRNKNPMLKPKQSLLQRVVKNNAFCWVAFFSSCGIMLLVYYCFQLVPFGEFTILRMDLYHQYAPLFAELYDRLVGFRSFLYSWTSGIGSSFLGNFFNYLSSPLSFLIVLFGRENVLEGIAALILLKSAIASFCFTYYLKRRHGMHDFATAAFGVLYSFCGFFIAYYWDVMWLDGMAFFPLVILGIEWLIERKKIGLYITSLTLTMLSNYYMGYMAAIFSVIYFFFHYFLQYTATELLVPLPLGKGFFGKRLHQLRHSRFLSAAVRFGIASVAVGGLSAFMLLPVYSFLQQSSATSGDFPTKFQTYFKVFDFLANHLASVDPTIRSSGEDVLPNVYCGLATVMLVPLYLFTKSIPLREKVLHVGLLAVTFFSFNTTYTNYIWHGFHFPNDLPYRFSFMYSFLLLAIAYQAFRRLREFSGKEILGVGTAVLFGVILIDKIGSKNVDEMTVYVSLAFAVVYTLVFALLRQKKNQTVTMSLMLLCCVIAESAVANTDRYSMNITKPSFADDRVHFDEVKKELDAREGGNFYRMELADLRARMDPSWFGYNGVSVFSSMAYEKLSNMEASLGMFSNYINSYTYYRQTPIYNMMHSLKYIMQNEGDSAPPMSEHLYTPVTGEGSFQAFENKYNLPIAYCVDSKITDWNSSQLWSFASPNPFVVQRNYFRHATGVDDVLTQLYPKAESFDNVYDIPVDPGASSFSFEKIIAENRGSITFSLTAEEDQHIYVFIKSNEMKKLTAIGNGYAYEKNLDETYIIDLGYCEEGQTLELEMEVNKENASGSFSFLAYALDMERFLEGYEKLRQGQLNVTRFDETHIAGTVTAQEECVLYTSIPFDKGWRVTVDGKKIPAESLLALEEALLAVPLTAGEHSVTFDYMPPFLIPGALISCATLLLLLAYALLRRRKEEEAMVPALASVRFENFFEDFGEDE